MASSTFSRRLFLSLLACAPLLQAKAFAAEPLVTVHKDPD
jgi:hypothetical protein